MSVRVRIVVVALTVTAISLTGCTPAASPSSGAPSAPLTGTPAPTSVTDPPSPSRSTTAKTRPSSKTTPSLRATAGDVDQDACTQDRLLSLVKQKFDDPATGLIIERVDIKRCRNNYAHVYAITAANPSDQPQYEDEQLFLRYVDGRWESVVEGSGVSCEDPDILPELRTACRALGYL